MKTINQRICLALILGSCINALQGAPALTITQRDREAAYSQCRKEHLIRLGASTAVPVAVVISSLLVATLVASKLGSTPGAAPATVPTPEVKETVIPAIPVPRIGYGAWLLSGAQSFIYEASKSAVSSLIALPATIALNVITQKLFAQYRDTVTVIPSTLSFLHMQVPAMTGTVAISRALYNFALSAQQFSDGVSANNTAKAQASLAYMMGHLDWSADHLDDSITGLSDWATIRTALKDLIDLADQEENLGTLNDSVQKILSRLTTTSPYSMATATAV